MNDANLAGPDSHADGAAAFRCVRPRHVHGSQIATGIAELRGNTNRVGLVLFGESDPGHAIAARIDDDLANAFEEFRFVRRADELLVAAAECEKRPVKALEFTGIAKDGENDKSARTIELDAANAGVHFNGTPVGPPDFELNAVRCAARKPRPKDSGVILIFTNGKQRRFRDECQALGRNSEEIGAPRIRLQNDTCLVIYNQDGVTGGIEKAAIFLLGAADVAEQVPGSPYAQDQQQSAGSHGEQVEQITDPTITFCQRRREVIFRKSETRVARFDFLEDAPHRQRIWVI